MKRDPNKLFYRFAPVRDIDTLAEVLELSRPQLERLARRADRMYSPVMQKKKDGSPRKTWNAHRQLKAVHELIEVRFLAKVTYPRYLQGGIKDPEHPAITHGTLGSIRVKPASSMRTSRISFRPRLQTRFAKSGKAYSASPRSLRSA